MLGVGIEGREWERAAWRLGLRGVRFSVGSEANWLQSALDDFRRDGEKVGERGLFVNVDSLLFDINRAF